MEITEVRIKLVEKSAERLRAFCSVTLDGDFVIRDLKIIDGANGAFVAMPSRKLADRCGRCGCKNHLRAKYCNDCGNRLNENRAPKDAQGRSKLHADVAHPINAGCRERIQSAVIKAFHDELERAKSPDYRPPKYDDFDDDLDEFAHEPSPPREPVQAPVRAAADGAEAMGDYNSLIAELKREAAGRRQKQDEGRRGGKEALRRDLDGDHGSEPATSEEGRQHPLPAAGEQNGTRSAGRAVVAGSAQAAPGQIRSTPGDEFSSGL